MAMRAKAKWDPDGVDTQSRHPADSDPALHARPPHQAEAVKMEAKTGMVRVREQGSKEKGGSKGEDSERGETFGLIRGRA